MNRTPRQRTVSRIALAAASGGAILVAGCAGTHPAPAQQLADVQSASRSANELGAQSNPQAQLYLKLADEQLKQAKAAVADDDNQRANGLLMRAKADAELAVALTRDGTAREHAGKATTAADAAHANHLQTGATP